MPTVEHMAGGHDDRVQYLMRLAVDNDWPVALQEGYEKRLPDHARRILALQSTLPAHSVRNKPDLLFASPFHDPFYLDVKTTTFRQDTEMIAVELFPACSALRECREGMTYYFDLDGYLVRGDHLQRLVRHIHIPRSRWLDGSDACRLYQEWAVTYRPDLDVIRVAVSSEDASGDPFVLIPRKALTGFIHRQATLTEAFIRREEDYRMPNLSWPFARVSMAEISLDLPDKELGELLDVPVNEKFRTWLKGRREMDAVVCKGKFK